MSLFVVVHVIITVLPPFDDLFHQEFFEQFEQAPSNIGSFPSTGLGGGIGLNMVNTENFAVPDRMVGLGTFCQLYCGCVCNQ